MKKYRCYGMVCLLFGLWYLYFHISSYHYASYTLTNRKLKCEYSKLERMKLLNLTYEIHDILFELQLDHWLMYGSIFGALRADGPLPWDYDVDLGMRGEQFTTRFNPMF